MRTNPIRFSGMASGMDTDSIVKDMMRPQQYKIDTQKKAQALLQLKQDAWKDMNKKLFDFHKNFTDKMRLTSTFTKSNTASSNKDAISIASDAIIPQGAHSFEVSKLAEAASIAGKVTTLPGKVIDGDTKITDLINFPANIIAQKDGEKEAKKEITLKIILNENQVGKEKVIEIKVGENDTIKSLEKKMNDKNINAKYDVNNGMFFVNSGTTGLKETITFTAPDVEIDIEGLEPSQISQQKSAGRELFRKLGLLEVGKTSSKIHGEDATYMYNKKEYTSSTNTIEVNGIKATLKAAGTGPVTISSEPDTDSIYTFVKEFVTEYNKLIDEINTKTGTKPGKNIDPLTAEERKSMSESEIKLWEDKLNSSLFYRDEQLTSFAASAREILGGILGPAEGETEAAKYNSLASLGIVTGSWEDKGKLYIEGDEDSAIGSAKPNKLKAAIEANAEDVTKFFVKMGKKLYDNHNTKLASSSKIKSSMNFYNDKAMTDKVKTFGEDIAKLEERMYRMEKMQYAKFATMEKMLSTLNNQGSWLAQQFGGN